MNSKHLKEVGMSYIKHLTHAWVVGFALLIHGVFPFILTTFARDRICTHPLKDEQNQ